MGSQVAHPGGLAEIDACDPAVLIYSLYPWVYGRLHCALLERTRGRKTKQERKREIYSSNRVKETERKSQMSGGKVLRVSL